MRVIDYRRAWCDLRAAPLCLREWADDVLDAEEERAALDWCYRTRTPQWYIDDIDWVWVRP